jgi:hypothetical protein
MAVFHEAGQQKNAICSPAKADKLLFPGHLPVQVAGL